MVAVHGPLRANAKQMPDPEEIFQCPYCGSANFLALDYSAGTRQAFVNDCETCCKPMLVKIAIDGDIVCINVEQENA